MIDPIPASRVRVVAAQAQNHAGSNGDEVSSGARRRGHARRNADGKFTPSGDYEVGFARPPARHRFRHDNPGGPGRPKGSLSHDALMRKELKQKRPVRIDGKTLNLSTRDLIVKTTLKDALAGDKLARRFVLTEIARLFPPELDGSRAPSNAELNESDARTLEEFRSGLLEQLLGSEPDDPANVDGDEDAQPSTGDEA